MLRNFIVLFVFCLLFQTHAVAQATSGLDSLVKLDSSCLDYQIVGICFCGTPPHPCGFIVKHYLPVAIIEVVKSPGDSLFGGAGSSKTGVTNISTVDGNYRGFEVRVWEIGDTLRTIATSGVSCALCTNNDASGGSTGISAELDNGIGAVHDGLDQVSNPLSGFGGCAGADQVTGLVDNILNNALPKNPYLTLLYDTEMDPINWRTGCRDLAKTTMNGPVSALACAVEGISRDISTLTGDQFGNTDLSSDMCIGSWQTLYPRQFKTIGLSEPIAAATVAYRAAHIAANTLGTFDFEVSNNIHLQPVHPKMGSCIKPGENIIKAEAEIKPSKNGVYGFVWWVKTRCCKKFDSVGDCVTG